MGRFFQVGIPGFVDFDYEVPIQPGDLLRGSGRRSSSSRSGKGLGQLSEADVLPEHSARFNEILQGFSAKNQGFAQRLQKDRQSLPQVKRDIAVARSEFRDTYFSEILPMFNAKKEFDRTVASIDKGSDLSSNERNLARAAIVVSPDHTLGRKAITGGVALKRLDPEDQTAVGTAILKRVEKDVQTTLGERRIGDFRKVLLKEEVETVRKDALKQALIAELSPFAPGEQAFSDSQGFDVDETNFVDADGNFNTDTRLGQYAQSLLDSPTPRSLDFTSLGSGEETRAKERFKAGIKKKGDTTKKQNRNFKKFVSINQSLLEGGGQKVVVGGRTFLIDPFFKDLKTTRGLVISGVGFAVHASTDPRNPDFSPINDLENGSGPWIIDEQGDVTPFNFDTFKDILTLSEAKDLEVALDGIGALDNNGVILLDKVKTHDLGDSSLLPFFLSSPGIPRPAARGGGARVAPAVPAVPLAAPSTDTVDQQDAIDRYNEFIKQKYGNE